MPDAERNTYYDNTRVEPKLRDKIEGLSLSIASWTLIEQTRNSKKKELLAIVPNLENEPLVVYLPPVPPPLVPLCVTLLLP